ncbi:MAG TPA: MBL fold metallo-hydrolase [Devosiaceae bacterium]|nr:MBL fold metallo-hydrolase [Devosiaceae bacterium]
MPDSPYICITCGVQYAPSGSPPTHCPICEDERQYVNPNGQAWTTPGELRQIHRIDWRELGPGFFGMGTTPGIAISQRALVVAQTGGAVMWDCIPLVHPDGIEKLRALGGLRAIAISHPHFFAAMVEWSEALDNAPIYLHEDLAPYVMRPSANIRFWAGETHDLGQGITLIRCGGHFRGSTVLHWAAGEAGRGALLTGDTIMVAADPRWMSFMRSFPNYIPLNRRAVDAIVAAVEPFAFDRLYGAWWGQVSSDGAKRRLKESAARYQLAIAD